MDQTTVPTDRLFEDHGHACLDSSSQNQTQMPTDCIFEDRGHACLVRLEKGHFTIKTPKSSTSQNRF